MEATTAGLAEFIAGTQYADIPADVVAKLRLHLLDLVGSQIVGARQHWNVLVREYAAGQSSSGPCSFIGSSFTGRPGWAALANATTAQGFEADDYHSAAMYHPGAIAIPASAAMSQAADASDEDFMTAVAIAYEVGIRIGMGADGGLVAGRGFHSPTSIGPFAAAAAAGKLLGQDENTLLHTLGIAGSHSGGTMAYTNSGGEVKRLHAGLGCMGGIRAAELADRGLTGPSGILEDDRGFYRAFSSNVNLEVVTAGLGQRWMTLDSAMKRYCAYAGIQAPLQAIHEMMAEDGLRAANVREIVVGLDANGARSAGAIGPRPGEMIAAQFSVHFSVGLALTAGGNEYSHYLDAEKERFRDPATVAVAEKVRVEVDPVADATFLQNRSCHVVVHQHGGRMLERRVNAPGSAAAPLPVHEVRTKFRALGGLALSQAELDQVEQIVLGLPGDHSLRDLLAILSQDRAEGPAR